MAAVGKLSAAAAVMVVLAVVTVSADPDLLQDVCVADLASGTHFQNSFPTFSSFFHQLATFSCTLWVF